MHIFLKKHLTLKPLEVYTVQGKSRAYVSGSLYPTLRNVRFDHSQRTVGYGMRLAMRQTIVALCRHREIMGHKIYEMRRKTKGQSRVLIKPNLTRQCRK